MLWTAHTTRCPPQEVVSHCKKLTRKNKEQLSEMMALDKQKGLKSLSKEKRQKLEAYQHLFYLLQVSGLFWTACLRLLGVWDLGAVVPAPPLSCPFPSH